MLLSRLEISGFKSFPNKTVIDFDGGITGVVGPNGCGKSNILDSIRWVLGEQRTSVLRSSRMEEVIFSGTSQLKPIGMAEVTLYIKNNRGLLPIEYDDLSITRRLYRSGESEYMLNKNQCRLKDIVELFLDTGMGPHAYSVIQQGMVDAILSDRTEDRRSLFEEAAGVTRYKHRKKEAENKLEATEADLLRLGDIIDEIEKQVIMLRRQAKRAQKYAKQKELLKNIECTLAGARLFSSQERYKELLESKRGLQIDIEASSAEIEKYEFNLQEEKLKLTEHEAQAAGYRQAESDMAVKSARIESDIKLNKQRAETSSNEIQNYKLEIGALENRIQTLENGVSENRLRIKDVDSQKKSSEDQNEKIEADLERLSKEMTEAEAALQEQRTNHSGITERISGIKAEAVSLREMKEGLEQKIAQLENDAGEYDRFRDENRLGVRKLEETNQDIIKKIETSKISRTSKSKEIPDIEEKLAHSKDKLSELRSEFSGLQARLELLDQLIESGEGYSGGAKALMSWSEKPVGMLSPLAETLKVPEDYRVPVTAALGQMGEVIPVRSYVEAESAIEYLKSSDGGRASFLILEGLDESKLNDGRPENADGFMGYLDDLVSYPVEYRPAVKLLLNRIALFDSKHSASSVDGKWRHFTRVTLDGTVYMPSGFVSGGKTIPTVLGRKQDSDSIRAKLEKISSAI
ncbi:MAG: chromosome segregation protein SMC, partial [candidate division Zixibacteria bacterium]